MPLDFPKNDTYIEREHAACGVAILVNVPPNNQEGAGLAGKPQATHQVVIEGLDLMEAFEYRSGWNSSAGVSDGVGGIFYGLPTAFFNKKIQEKAFLTTEGLPCPLHLEEDHFAIGQYFFPNDAEQILQAKRLITEQAAQYGLSVLGWRDLQTAINLECLLEVAHTKIPAMWQAILMQMPSESINLPLEQAVQKAATAIAYQAQQRNMDIHIASQSAEAITYKGLVRPRDVRHFFLDLTDELFTASGTAVHTRFATNTAVRPAQAQPLNGIAHNGEINSAATHEREARIEAQALHYQGPNPTGSDTQQLSMRLMQIRDLLGISQAEALIRLMPPAANFSPEINAMLTYFRLERSPYNGPAFIVTSAGGYSMAKLDAVGLRPANWVRWTDETGVQRFYAGSDHYDYEKSAQGKCSNVEQGLLEPGGMIMVTPQGELLKTNAILELIAQRYNGPENHYFQNLLQQTLFPLPEVVSPPGTPLEESLPTPQLNRMLFSAGYDYEVVERSIRYMAENANELVAAMGDDTDPLHAEWPYMNIAHYFHQLFAQVTAPPLDSIKERASFNLSTSLGPVPGLVPGAKRIGIASPILAMGQLHLLEKNPHVRVFIIDITEDLPSLDHSMLLPEYLEWLRAATKKLCLAVRQAAESPEGGILILSDRLLGSNRAAIPDLLAVAAASKHLENLKLMHKVSIVVDSQQVADPHQAAALLTMGARGIYPRGAYAIIRSLYPADSEAKAQNYKTALAAARLPVVMAKMGITDIDSYVNGKFMAVLGLDLSLKEGDPLDLEIEPSLANIFTGIYSPLKGMNLGHVAKGVILRHQQAYDPKNNFNILPHFGHFLSQKGGVKHGFGPIVPNQFKILSKFNQDKQTIRSIYDELSPEAQRDLIPNLSHYSPEFGFLDPREKISGIYPPAYLERFILTQEAIRFFEVLDHYRWQNPTAIKDRFRIIDNDREPLLSEVQSQAAIRQKIFTGSMSQGALTVSDPTTGKAGAHETLTASANAVGVNPCSGEGGVSPLEWEQAVTRTASKQVASGRFGVTLHYLMHAYEIEIKVAQGAKPGEGGEIPGAKISSRFAAQRGGLPGTPFNSPPPHHDIYSIEDLTQLIDDIKGCNPNVAVKLVSSAGIGMVAVGVAKTLGEQGVIEIAGNSGGTGAAKQSSIKHTGLPSEIGLAEVDAALRIAGLRDHIKLRVSGGIKTASDIIFMAIVGADLFSLGTMSMITINCVMQRTCDRSCESGVAADGHLFKGEQLNAENYLVSLGAAVQKMLKELGVPSLEQLRGRTDLLQFVDESMSEQYDFSLITKRSHLPPYATPEEAAAREAALPAPYTNPKETALIEQISALFSQNPEGFFESPSIELTPQDRTFGTRIASHFAAHFKQYPQAKITLHTMGRAGQSLGFVLPKNMTIKHVGTIENGGGKSLCGGKLVIIAPPNQAGYSALGCNATLYGASGGHFYINGVVGQRCGVLMKGDAEGVVEGAGDFAFSFMTSGTVLILGPVGKELCTGASGGVVFLYDPTNVMKPAPAARVATQQESEAYTLAIQTMIQNHAMETNSQKAQGILMQFNPLHFKVLIPVYMDNIKTLQQLKQVVETYDLRQSPLTKGMQVWFEQKLRGILNTTLPSQEDISHLRLILNSTFVRLPHDISHQILQLLKQDDLHPLKSKIIEIEETGALSRFSTHIRPAAHSSPNLIQQMGTVLLHPRKFKEKRPVHDRLRGGIAGALDDLLLDPLENIRTYVATLAKDAEGCSGCAQPCAGGEEVSTGCTMHKSIHLINAELKKLGNFNPNERLTEEQYSILFRAFSLQNQDSPFTNQTGALCPSPCEDACSESAPSSDVSGSSNPKRGGKRVGEPVHIKDIEFALYLIGDTLGLYAAKEWSAEERTRVFGTGPLAEEEFTAYTKAMVNIKPLFQKAPPRADKKKLIIVGSGPAGMQMAWEALRDGVEVQMFERSSLPGGLLIYGIPAHKFDKTYVHRNFERLIQMGLELHCNSEVTFDPITLDYKVGAHVIANDANKNQCVALCLGTGKPKTLAPSVTAELDAKHEGKIIQAIDFLHAANKVAAHLQANPLMSSAARDALIKTTFGKMDPRNKKILVIGGGDTAQDAIRVTLRYFSDICDSINEEKVDDFTGVKQNSETLVVAVRGGPLLENKSPLDYPFPPQMATPENKLRKEEHEYRGGETHYLVEPVKITQSAAHPAKMSIEMKKTAYAAFDEIQGNPKLRSRWESIQREMKPLAATRASIEILDEVQMVICAMGFSGGRTIPMVAEVEQASLRHTFLAGDVAAERSNMPQIIVGAHANASGTYKQIRKALGIHDQTLPLPHQTPLVRNSLFAKPPSAPLHKTQSAPTALWHSGGVGAAAARGTLS